MNHYDKYHSFFCNLYNHFPESEQKTVKLRNSLLRRIIRHIATPVLSYHFGKTETNPLFRLSGTVDNPREEENGGFGSSGSRKRRMQSNVIVSLTSFPARIGRVWMVVESLLRQTVKPEKIILWLSQEQFPDVSMIPESLRRLEKRGLDIRIVTNDIRSHKKYYYVLKEFPESTVILTDDDIIYHPGLLEELLMQHEIYPDHLICAYSRIISYSEKGEILPYKTWNNNRNCMQENLFFGSGGGTLIPPHTLSEDVLKLDLALQLTPNADDIWLNIMARLKGTPIRSIPKRFVILPVIIKNNIKLSRTNYFRSGNDEQLKKILSHYKLDTLKIK